MVRPILKSLVAFLACVALLSGGLAAKATAAEWPTWPRTKPVAPATSPGTPAPPPESAKPATEAAGKPGEEGGKKVAAGITAGTVAKGALIAAGIVGIAIAIGGGGGGTATNH